ncbi:MAG: response regulator transcription factor [Lachnospiraceae bacterium]|nr:response regulator transcription factor [Lachnospiraceae bacterium]
MIKIALVDDEAQHRAALEKHLTAFFRGKDTIQCAPFSDALDLLNCYDFSFDIIFLDIDMKHSNGMEAARRLRKMDDRVLLVFETRLAQYAVEGYLVDAVGYLIKPIDYYSLSLVMTKAYSALQKARKTAKIVVMDMDRKVLVDSTEIRYIEVLDHMLIYHTVSGDRKDWNTLNRREKELTPFSFFRCHRCFLVNLRHVTGIDPASDEVMLGEVRLPISRGKKAALLDAVMNLYTMKEGL